MRRGLGRLITRRLRPRQHVRARLQQQGALIPQAVDLPLDLLGLGGSQRRACLEVRRCDLELVGVSPHLLRLLHQPGRLAIIIGGQHLPAQIRLDGAQLARLIPVQGRLAEQLLDHFDHGGLGLLGGGDLVGDAGRIGVDLGQFRRRVVRGGGLFERAMGQQSAVNRPRYVDPRPQVGLQPLNRLGLWQRQPVSGPRDDQVGRRFLGLVAVRRDRAHVLDDGLVSVPGVGVRSGDRRSGHQRRKLVGRGAQRDRTGVLVVAADERREHRRTQPGQQNHRPPTPNH